MLTPQQTKTITIEKTDRYDRVMTQCNDQNYVRDYYMNQVSMGKAIAAMAYITDILMDMSLLTMAELKAQNKLSAEQIVTLDKLVAYNTQLSSLKLTSNNWEIDWIYGEVKQEQNNLNLKFFEKRQELQLGEALDINK